MGIAAASAAVRRAPAPNSAPGGRTIRLGLTRRNANGEGAVGSARGGRAPRIRLNRTASSSILGRVLHFGCSGALCQVGRVTPCAPLGERIRVCGAHGVTRPTLGDTACECVRQRPTDTPETTSDLSSAQDFV